MSDFEHDSPPGGEVDTAKRRLLKKAAYTAPALMVLGGTRQAFGNLPSPCGDPPCGGAPLSDDDPVLDELAEQQND